jgi:hypothetical protein
MAMELRHIVFRSDEVVAALKFYWERIGRSHPRGLVQRCGPEGTSNDGDIRFRIVIAPETRDQQPTHLVLEKADVAAALILYCKDSNIPLPRIAEKSLQIFGSQLCLLATMNPLKNTPLATEELRL